MKHEEGELKKKQADLKSTAKGYEKDKVAFEAMKKDLSKIEVCKFVSRCNLNKYTCHYVCIILQNLNKLTLFG